MKNRFSLLALIYLFLFIQCKTTTVPQNSSDDGKIEVVFLHINDVYEIAPLKGDNLGGMARVATLYQRLKNENPNTLFVHGGDFLNPSLIGTLKLEGERIKGQHMVEVMNSAGVDVVAFGNHEFDLKEKELQARLNESTFDWIGTNVRKPGEQGFTRFYKEVNGKKEYVNDHYIWYVSDKDGTSVKIGLFSTCINSNPKDFVYYENLYTSAIEEHNYLKQETDLVLGLTHLEEVQDKVLAKALPNVPLIMGGHDHHHMLVDEGAVKIAKADANAKTAYVHRLIFDKNTGISSLNSSLITIDESIPEEPKTKAIVDKWLAIQDMELEKIYPEAYEIIYTTATPLDGRESSIRHKQTNLGGIITRAMKKASKNKVDGVFFNSGSVRLDDQLSGKISAYDIFRTMPFGGSIVEVQMKGSLLQKMLIQGLENEGIGGYLQIHDLAFDKSTNAWLVQGQPLDENKDYWIATSDFLLTGLESGMSYFTPKNKEILKIDRPKTEDDIRYDIRVAVIQYLRDLR